MAAQFAYTPKAQELQKRFDTEALAAAELAVIVHDVLSPPDRGFIESSEFFFLSTVDPSGSPTVSYKGGATGFVKMSEDGTTLMFPSFDGNGMFYSMGNIAHTSKIGMLFISFTTPMRLRVQGHAELTDDPAIVGLWPGAQFAVDAAQPAVMLACEPKPVSTFSSAARNRAIVRSVPAVDCSTLSMPVARAANSLPRSTL